jgi:uncharacterized damage-inducible protein DinB
MEIRTIQPFLQYFGNVRERTMRVARCIPADKLDWTYTRGKFTLGDLLRHIAVAERFVWAETLQGHKSRYTTHGKELADGYENVIRFLQRKCKTPHDAEIKKWKWLRLMVEHEIHHRGQIYLCLGMLSVPTPPTYGLTSEQVRA